MSLLASSAIHNSTTVGPWSVTSSVRRGALVGCSSASALQTLRNCSPVSAIQSFRPLQYNGMQHTDLRHCLSAASAVCQLQSAVRTAYPALDVWGRRFLSVAGPMASNLPLYSFRHPARSCDSFRRALTSLRCRWQTRATQCPRPTVLYTDVDGQCGKLVTETDTNLTHWPVN